MAVLTWRTLSSVHTRSANICHRRPPVKHVNGNPLERPVLCEPGASPFRGPLSLFCGRTTRSSFYCFS